MKLIVQNLATEYEDEGAGRAALFLHGWQDNLRTWDVLAPLMASMRIVRLDLPGFGKSETPKQAWNLDNYVQFVEGFIQKLNLQVDTLVAHSFGARIVIKGVGGGELKAGSIVLIASAGIAKKRTLLQTLAKLGGIISYIPPFVFWRDKLRKYAYGFIGSDYMRAGALKETFLKIIAEDVSGSARNIKIPALLVWGSRDAETPLADGKKFAKLIQGSTLKVIDEAGHFVHQEKPQDVAKMIREFL